MDRAPSLDRLISLTESEDRERLTILWKLLAEHWSDYEHGLLDSQWRCVTSSAHKIERVRHCPSPGLHQLLNYNWVPAERSGKHSVERPGQVWRPVTGMPKAVAGILCRPAEGMHVSAGMAETLGLVDAGRPSADQIITLLGDIERRCADEDELPPEAVDGALWLLRKLNELASTELIAVGAVPLVATRCHPGCRSMPVRGRRRS